ncbi:Gfo/Idh/MocA family oxidoreductase [Gordonia sp. SID5947]|uniref:Gfo/Idh/MocA family protein n=1 Tax=Gordonia sp. SID5947 TaxID=2690315 RepID=UPI00136A21DB|nr:Gfo/Idh/MocA family oxidoreductase [Gordonia sp. SID5947]MYR08872.1 Gfo/Idh/MocA family oxidoreductase [Gordonia sp. SID5947]
MGLTVGVIGLGRIGSFHADTLSAIPAVDDVVVTDAVPAAVDSTLARLPSARAVIDADALLGSGIDAVVIASATPTHAELIEKAVAAGIPTLCEKPIALSVADSAAVVRRVDDAGVPVRIGYNRRFDPAMAAARATVASGDLGFITTVRSTTLDPAPPPRDYVAVSGGIFRDCAVHDFDTVRWLLDDEVVEVYATGGNQGDPHFATVGDVDSAAVLLTFASGTIGVVSVTRYNGRGYDCRLEAHGSADSVVAGWDDGTPVRNLQSGSGFPAGTPHRFFMDRFAQAYRAELTAFCDEVAGDRRGATALCTAADALEVAIIAEAADRSAATHRPVRTDAIRAHHVIANHRGTATVASHNQ